MESNDNDIRDAVVAVNEAIRSGNEEDLKSSLV